MDQFLLVFFDRQRVIAPALEEDLLHRLDLRMKRVGQGRFVDEFQVAQQFSGGGDFVAAGFDRHGAQPAALAVDGADQLYMRVAQRLAIHNDQLVLRRPQDLVLPQQERAFHRAGVHVTLSVSDTGMGTVRKGVTPGQRTFPVCWSSRKPKARNCPCESVAAYSAKSCGPRRAPLNIARAINANIPPIG